MNKLLYRSGPMKLTAGYTVSFTLDAQKGRIDTEWEPAVPTGIILKSVMPFYKKAREEFLSTLDMKVVVIDL